MKFDFSDINLVPKKCVVSSRSECDTSVTLGKHTFNLPIVPANMECVISEELVIKLVENNYFYIMHRFCDIFKFAEKMKSLNLLISISVGVNGDSYDLIKKLKENNIYPDYITVDIAHGHSIKMKSMIEFIKSNFPESFVIAGNISTSDAAMDLESWGADATKVGIGPGSACTTYPTTGFGSRNCQASIIHECSTFAKKPIIADGGIKEPGDISKSLVMGASMVMVGGMLSGYSDSPGSVVYYNDKKYKEFWGSASQFQSNKSNRIEGKKVLVDYKEISLLDEYQYLKECLQSSISYGGGKDLVASQVLSLSDIQKIDNELELFQRSNDDIIKLPMNSAEKFSILLHEMFGADADIIQNLSQKRYICYITKHTKFNHHYCYIDGKMSVRALQCGTFTVDSILSYNGKQIFYLYSIVGNLVRGAFVDDDGIFTEHRDNLIDEIISD